MRRHSSKGRPTYTLTSTRKKAAPSSLESALLDDLGTGMTLLLSDDEQRVSSLYGDESNVADLFTPRLL